MIGDDQIRIEIELFTKAVAGRAGALRGVEAEQARFDFGNGKAGHGAGEFFAEDDAAGGGVVAEHFFRGLSLADCPRLRIIGDSP